MTTKPIYKMREFIRNRPRASFLTVKYLGIFILIASQLAILAQYAIDARGLEVIAGTKELLRFLRAAGQMSVPLIFISLLSCIFQKHEQERLPQTVAFYAICALLFFAAEIYLFENFVEPILRELIVGIVEQATGDLGEEGRRAMDELLYQMFPAIANFNIFVDCFLCSLVYLFSFYTPRWADSKRKLLVFRSLTLLPVCYIVGAFVVHALNTYNVFNPGIYFGALLPHKRISYWFFFGGVLVYLKFVRRKNGASLDKNANLDRSTVVICVALVAVSLLDLALGNVHELYKIGLGRSYSMALALPVLFFFDMRKEPRFPWGTYFIPVVYIVHYVALWYLFDFASPGGDGGGLLGYFLNYWLTGFES